MYPYYGSVAGESSVDAEGREVFTLIADVPDPATGYPGYQRKKSYTKIILGGTVVAVLAAMVMRRRR